MQYEALSQYPHRCHAWTGQFSEAEIRAPAAGERVFRFNFLGSHADLGNYDIVRALEAEAGRPIAVLADMQGPNSVSGVSGRPSHPGRRCRVSPGTNEAPGTAERATLPHPEIFEQSDLALNASRRRQDPP